MRRRSTLSYDSESTRSPPRPTPDYTVIVHRQPKYLQKGEYPETEVRLGSGERIVLDAQRPPNAFRLKPTREPDEQPVEEEPVSGKNLLKDPLMNDRFYRVGFDYAIDMDCRWYRSELLFTKVDLISRAANKNGNGRNVNHKSRSWKSIASDDMDLHRYKDDFCDLPNNSNTLSKSASTRNTPIESRSSMSPNSRRQFEMTVDGIRSISDNTNGMNKTGGLHHRNGRGERRITGDLANKRPNTSTRSAGGGGGGNLDRVGSHRRRSISIKRKGERRSYGAIFDHSRIMPDTSSLIYSTVEGQHTDTPLRASTYTIRSPPEISATTTAGTTSAAMICTTSLSSVKRSLSHPSLPYGSSVMKASISNKPSVTSNPSLSKPIISKDGTVPITGTRTVVPPNRKRRQRRNSLPEPNIPGTRVSIIKRAARRGLSTESYSAGSFTRSASSSSSFSTSSFSGTSSMRSGPPVVISNVSQVTTPQFRREFQPATLVGQDKIVQISRVQPTTTAMASTNFTPSSHLPEKIINSATSTYHSPINNGRDSVVTYTNSSASYSGTLPSSSYISPSAIGNLISIPRQGYSTNYPTSAAVNSIRNPHLSMNGRNIIPSTTINRNLNGSALTSFTHGTNSSSSNSHTYETCTESSSQYQIPRSPRQIPTFETASSQANTVLSSRFKPPSDRDMRPIYGSEIASTINHRGIVRDLGRNGRAACCGAGRIDSIDDYYNRSLVDAIHFNEVSTFRGESDYTSVSGTIVKRLLAE